MTKLLLVEDHEALDQIKAQSPDLILLDMNLPVMDGWTVARTLRTQGSKTPVIALTAHAMIGDRAKALEAGCDDYHPKPVSFSELLKQIDDALLKREQVDT